MHEHELWLTRLFNDHLAGAGNSILNLIGVHASDPARPWRDFITMPLLVAAIILVVILMLRSRLSVDRPGILQHFFEVIYQFLHETVHDQIGPDGPKHLPLF